MLFDLKGLYVLSLSCKANKNHHFFHKQKILLALSLSLDTECPRGQRNAKAVTSDEKLAPHE